MDEVTLSDELDDATDLLRVVWLAMVHPLEEEERQACANSLGFAMRMISNARESFEAAREKKGGAPHGRTKT